MPTYVLYKGRLVDKRERPVKREARSSLPAPAVQSFDAYASPIDGSSISSHRQREKDLNNSGSYDPRDTPVAFRKARDARRKSNQSAKSSRNS